MTNQVLAKRNTIYSKIVTFFLLLTIAAIFIVLYFALSKVTIKIHSNLENKQQKILVEMQAENADNVSTDAILGKIITTDFELSATTTSQMEQVIGKRAGGYVTIYNNTAKDQGLVKTTRLLTPDQQLFRIIENVNVPAGGQIKVWADADQEGESYVSSSTTMTIPGLALGLQTKIYAESKDGLTLTSMPQYVVSQANIDELKDKIKELAKAKALEDINKSLSDDLKINDQKLFLDFKTLESSQVGDKSQEAVIKQKITASGLVFSETDLIKLAESKFTKSLDSNQSLDKFLTDQTSYKVLELNPETDHAVIEVALNADIKSNNSPWQIDKEKLVGLDEAGIRSYLQELRVEDVDIKFFPAWIKTAPRFKDHIIIE